MPPPGHMPHGPPMMPPPGMMPPGMMPPPGVGGHWQVRWNQLGPWVGGFLKSLVFPRTKWLRTWNDNLGFRNPQLTNGLKDWELHYAASKSRMG